MSCLEALVQTLTVAHSDFDRSAFWIAVLIWARVGFLAPVRDGSGGHGEQG